MRGGVCIYPIQRIGVIVMLVIVRAITGIVGCDFVTVVNVVFIMSVCNVFLFPIPATVILYGGNQGGVGVKNSSGVEVVFIGLFISI